MRATNAVFSDMPGGRVYNLWWGDSTVMRQRGIYQYTLSPFQSKAAPKMIQHYLFQGYRRLSKEAMFFTIPFAMGYGIYAWAKKTDHDSHSKAAHIAAHAH